VGAESAGQRQRISIKHNDNYIDFLKAVILTVRLKILSLQP
jgi:hypothetical protein